VLELALDLRDAEELTVVGSLSVGATEAVGEGDELGAIAEFPERLAIAVRRRDRRCAERPSVIAASNASIRLFPVSLRTSFNASSTACDPPTLKCTRPLSPKDASTLSTSRAASSTFSA